MAIDTELLQFVSVEELLATKLRIPDFQRPFSWTPRMAAQLFTDVRDALGPRREDADVVRQPLPQYILGTVILLQREGCDHFEVVDGQQRLLTLYLLHAELTGNPAPDTAPRPESRVQASPIHLVRQELRRRVADLDSAQGESTQGERERFLQFLNDRTKLLRIVTDDEDEAFQFFDSQNYRGKALRPHDLLKAYHLREMVDASPAEQRAVAERWENKENELDRLFGTYLARIHWWSRNLPARVFTTDHIDMFKGLGRSTRLPGAEYHRAAKTILPAVQEWAAPAADEATQRNMQRALHQLETPIVAGKSFFDFTAFMLEETARLDRELFTPPTGPDLSTFRDAPRFRFCRELFIAAALYYTNKYSEEDLQQSRRLLLTWAYALRLGYVRLPWKSADNYARGQETRVRDVRLNLFAAIRDSLDPASLGLEDVQVPGVAASGHDDDDELARLLHGGDL